MVLTTDTETPSSPLASAIKTDDMHQLIKECGGGHLQFDQTKPECHSEIIQRVEKITQKYGEFLRCEIFDDAEEGTSINEEQRTSEGLVRQEEEKEEDTTHEEAEKAKESHKKGNDGGGVLGYFWSKREQSPEYIHPNSTVPGKAKLNLVLCGHDEKLKATVSKILRGKPLSVFHRESTLVSVKKEEKIHGRHITVVELPALTKLSEDEVINQTLRCVSLCDSRVHLFLLIIPIGPITDVDKMEIEMIHKIFYSKEHFMVLFTTEFSVDQKVTHFVTSTQSQNIVSLYGTWYSVMGLKDHRSTKQISDLLECIEMINLKPYSLQMYMKAQEKTSRLELEAQISKMDSKIKELQQKIHQEGEWINLLKYSI
uniref:AIG1-type G domain-containing protein n=1 Tax=Sinocyclocheilus grahami TaxID=75366 RepID=A0A672KPP2_SINGR